MKFLRRILPFAIILGAALLVLYSPDIAPEKYADLASFFRIERSRQGFSGYSIAAVSDGSVLYVDGFGTDGGGREIDADTVLFAPAAEKSFIALAALSLARERRLDLDAPVRKYLPWFGFADGSGGDVTIRHLISHTSGISDIAFDDFHDAAPDLTAAAMTLTSARPFAAPGKEFAFVDTGYQALALAMENAAERPFAALVGDRVFKPLGMTSTTVAALARPPRGNGTFFSSAVPREARYPAYGAPSGWTATTAADMGAYLSFMLAPEKAKRGPVSARAARTVFDPLVQGAPYGYGWYIGAEEGSRSAYHDGYVAGFSSRVLVMPDSRAGVAVLAAQGSYLQSLIALPALTEGALRIVREGSTTRPFPLHRLYILLLVVAAVHLIALGTQTGGAIGWAKDVRGRAEARGTRFPVRFAALRSWTGIAVRAAIAILAPAALGLAFDRSVGWRTIFALEPGAAAWCLTACFFGVTRNVARLAWLGRPTFIPRAPR
jgi:CubicO group peptidase (beta-lactamase class C family)